VVLLGVLLFEVFDHLPKFVFERLFLIVVRWWH
jgi:hypothetical protein